MQYTSKDIDRFWSHIDKEVSQTFYNGTRCWEWTAFRDKDGYGKLWLPGMSRGVHRISYELHFEDIPKDTLVLHHCDNPACCNPQHLFLGTHQDNMSDKVHKGRQTSKEKHGMHKLSAEQVEEIRKRQRRFARGGDSSYKLAKEFGVNQAHISDIVNYKVWK